MISIIICSRTKVIKDELITNINNTIGFSHELIVIDNSKNRYSIFEAYNIGIKNSNGEYLCFMHDDILIHTKDWGKKISQIFKEDEQIGLIGVAGSKIKTRMPSPWWRCEKEQQVIYILQHLKDYPKEIVKLGFKNKNLEEVAVIDGVFMVARKDQKIEFNRKMSGFHNYDSNLSLEYIINNYKIVVSNQILIEHFSIGTIDGKWVTSSINFNQLYNNYLPILKSSTISNGDLKSMEFNNGIMFITNLIDYGFYYQSLKYWIKLLLLKPFTSYHFIFLKKIFGL